MSETVPPTAPETETPVMGPPRNRRGLRIAIIAGGVVLVLLIAGGTWAIVNAFLGKNESATASAVAFPATTVAWTELSIDPSNGQKLEALGFINGLGGLKDALEESDLDVDFDDPGANTDLKKSLWDFLVDQDGSGLDDVSLDYDDDIKPWLGSRIAYGSLPSADADEPELIVAIEAKDTTAGIDAVEDLIGDLDTGVDLEVGEKNGYVIVYPDYVDIDDAFDEGTLSESTLFAKSAERAGEWGVVSYWADLGAAVSAASETYTSSIGDYSDRDYWEQEIRDNPYSHVPYPDYDFDLGGYPLEGQVFDDYDDYEAAYLDANIETLIDEQMEQYEGLADSQQAIVEQFEGVSSSGVLRFVDGTLELSGTMNGLTDMPQIDTDGDPLGALPASTMLAFSASGVGSALGTQLSDENLSLLSMIGAGALGSSEPITRDRIAEFFDENLGLEFPDDLDVLFGRQIVLSVDEDFEVDSVPSSSEGDWGAIPQSGAAITILSDDPDETMKAWESLIERFEEKSGSEFGLDLESDGDRVVISAGDYLDTVVKPDDTLGEASMFRRSLPAAEGASGGMFLNAAELVKILSSGMGDDGATTDMFDGLEAVGMTTTMESDDTTSFVLRVTTERD